MFSSYSHADLSMAIVTMLRAVRHGFKSLNTHTHKNNTTAEGKILNTV